MDRKRFLSAAIPVMGISTAFNDETKRAGTNRLFTSPPSLKRCDTIGVTSPGGHICEEDVQPCLLKLQQWGFTVKTGETIGARDFTFGGTDEMRQKDFQQMPDDPHIKAILCARGGYGIVRIIDKLNFRKFVHNPKWIIGFSDATVLHSHISKNFAIASVHAKMCNSFLTGSNNADLAQIESMESIRKCLTGEK